MDTQATMLSKAQLKEMRAEPLRGKPNRLERARDLAGVTQVDLATSTGLTQSYVSRIESGLYGPAGLPVETTRTLAHFFGCAIEDLFPAREAVAS